MTMRFNHKESFKIGDKVLWEQEEVEVVGYTKPGSIPYYSVAVRDREGYVYDVFSCLLTKIHQLKEGDDVFIKAKYLAESQYFPCIHSICTDIKSTSNPILVGDSEIYIQDSEGKLAPYKQD